MSFSAYPIQFYANRRAQTAVAAQRIFELLPEGLVLDRVADIGCGTGTWLAAALARGASSVQGIEGAWVTPEMLDDPRIEFVQGDLEQPLTLAPVDLAISLEVAEHLSPERAESFVADLVALAPAVLFSAAIPGQGGVNHVNEQWQSYWAGLFARHGRVPCDVIRPAIWSDGEIAPWYKQNIVLYVTPAQRDDLGLSSPEDLALLDVVHPAFWERANRELVHAGALPESSYLKSED